EFSHPAPGTLKRSPTRAIICRFRLSDCPAGTRAWLFPSHPDHNFYAAAWVKVGVPVLRSGEPSLLLVASCYGRQTMSDHVYRIIQVAGSSTKSLEDAIETAVARAARTLRQIGWFEVVETRGHVENGKVAHYQVTLKVGFTLDDDD